jgi:tetratricopeptide (TPR) repeat protein
MATPQPWGHDPIKAATTLHERSVSFRARGQHAQAESLALQALRTIERVVGPRHPGLANILINLGGVCQDRGRYSKAERLLRRSVDILSKSRDGPENRKLRVRSLGNLAGVYQVQGR